ncbi:MAG: class I SAM-dependent methyltransferase [Thermoanaerobaculia bacterium]|nr:class I SAM-dependent methyltransferase [Thermoanaerobaculia bacterium]
MADAPGTMVALVRQRGILGMLGFALRRARGFLSMRNWLLREMPGLAAEKVIDVLVNKRLGEAQPVFSMQRPAEIGPFLAQVEERRPRVVMEIGTASGGTLLLLARVAAPDAALISLDLPGGRHGGGYSALRRPLYRSFAREGQEIVLLQGDSHSKEMRVRVERALAGRPIDVLFVDGDHTYEGVRQDWLDYGPLVRPGGLVAFHDICPIPELPDVGVWRFWRELRMTEAVGEYIENDTQPGFGIGVFEVRS